MATKKFLRVTYLASIEGQRKLWERIFDRECAASDQVYQFGNIVGLTEAAKDRSPINGNNMEVLGHITARNRTERWTQMVGPNEIVALNDPEAWTNARSRKLLRDLWLGDDDPMRVAVAAHGRLLSHGGLTYGEWVDLGRPETAHKTAHLLNEKYARTLYQGRCYALGNSPNYSANPIWAHPSRELYPSWITAPEALPFDQVTGGGSLNEPEGRALADGEDSLYNYVDSIRYFRYGSRLEINGQRILSLGLCLKDEEMPSLTDDRQIYVERLELQEKPF